MHFKSSVLALVLGLFASSAWAQSPSFNQKTLTGPDDIQLTLLGTELSTVTVQATGGATMTAPFQVSDDGVNYISISGFPQPSGSSVTSATGDGYWLFTVAGHRYFRVHATAVTGSEVVTVVGTPGVVITATSGGGTPQPVTPANCTWVYSSVVLAAATSATILNAGSYKAVIVQNVGTNPVNRLAAGTSPITAGSAGIALDSATSPNVQGGSYVFPLPPSNAVQAISTLGTTVTVGTCS